MKPIFKKNIVEFFIDYLEILKSNNILFWIALYENLDETSKKWCHLKKKKVLFQQINASWRKSMKRIA